ncbi:tellurite resistance TerB family protein [Sulfitobacter sp. S190]|uniref:tellurite resistance TerB family protein n=1 Tax=Sulfitobacter sp. S190 TaxID=2867022 RepID=UPI0021A71736|nr:tellurite resistance TerB family protein [Sulfitobacter sp. S190]UWR23824.1 tellurite resistance TerB family protein [Sulfitobacter sp. S190]
MSLMKTLAKVAIGVAVAKGAKSVMERGRQQQGQTGTTQAGGGGLGGLLGGLAGAAGGSAGAGGGLNDMLGGMLGGSRAGGGLGSGGLGGLLESLGGAQGASSGSGGLGGLLGGLAGAAGAGGLLGGMSGAVKKAPPSNDSSFGAVLNSQFDQTPEPEIQPSQDQEATAGLMLAAMIQAAKSDGTFDDAEQQKLLKHLGDIDPDEAAFVRDQMQAPVNVEALVADTPEGMGQQVYAMSVLAIDLDTGEEAQYLHKLASAYGLQPAQVNEIHAQLGVPSLYT